LQSLLPLKSDIDALGIRSEGAREPARRRGVQGEHAMLLGLQRLHKVVMREGLERSWSLRGILESAGLDQGEEMLVGVMWHL
jgi:hypothetical protein